ncbi:S8/S53 family peptidase [Spirosoma utsteinense]|uniref:Subtilisin family serine protease n=1 Tax=Spirosoma utsteinense TaxID=2585773 RepID=A0ABR6WCB6_9BACT|nr:S8/S53 family peptidase [Spirosoma utsteinense]MBC3785272.1 subtilisin family serine protease [Spirosoma utsteinense]MBC3793924.1 subtilisin family serine protease [Spirosoma utsteinense]
MEFRNHEIVESGEIRVGQSENDTDKLHQRTISPVRDQQLDCEQREVARLQRRGVIPPVISINGRLLVKKQKIAILSKREIDLIGRDKTIFTIKKRKVSVRVVRVSDCPNPEGEYGKISYTALLEFDELNPSVIARNAFSGATFASIDQSNNFVLSGTLPGSKPSPPVQDDLISATAANSDFQPVDEKDISHYPESATCVVAVIDSGVKFDFANRPSQNQYQYTDRSGVTGPLQLVRGKSICGSESAGIGYCGITAYLDVPNTAGQPVPPLLDALKTLTRPQIAGSAFDDHRMNHTLESPAGLRSDSISGRHGTYITAIINQESDRQVSVLPVKAFNCGGYSTLFDLLSCLNYVLEQKRNGLPVYVMNASWVGSLDDEGQALLTRKFRALEKAGIIVVAAAGNQGKDLNSNNLYPARYSSVFTNVITVTSVEPAARTTGLGTKQEAINELVPEDDTSLMAHLNLDRPRVQYRLRGFKAVGNYSQTFVSIGVYGRCWSGFKSPFKDEPGIRGTSYAAAYVSGQIASYLHRNNIVPTAEGMVDLKQKLFEELTCFEKSLERTVQEGRLLIVNS